MKSAAPVTLALLAASVFTALASGGTGNALGPDYQFPEPPHGPIVNIAAAPVIVIGTAGEGRSYWADQERVIYTRTPFHVERAERGAPEPDIVVRTLGGALPGGLAQITEHQPDFRSGQVSRLFLRRLASGEYEVFGADQGKQDVLTYQAAAATTCPDGGTPGDGYCLFGYKFSSLDMPIVYRVNPNTSQVSGEESAVVAGFASWEDDPLSDMDWTYGGTTTLAVSARDGVSAVYWSMSPPCGQTNYLACSNRYVEGGKIVEFDVPFNDAYEWAVGVVAGRFDIQTLAVHEAGHSLGLNHVDDSNQTMYPWFDLGLTQRALGQGDLNGVRALYPPDADRDGIPDASDNCPAVFNPLQTDQDHDGIGDACDPDNDNDGVLNGSDLCPATVPGAIVDLKGCSDAQVDYDRDGVCNPAAPGAGPSRCTGSDNCMLWPNPAQDLPPWPTPYGDDDCDGFVTTPDEIWMGTDYTRACPITPTNDAWPPDINHDRAVDISDLLALKPVFGSVLGGPGYDQRRDLNADFAIDISDILILKPLFGMACVPR